ncbi:hypothetical protein GCM10028805_53040 [Spirosoma harenae]
MNRILYSLPVLAGLLLLTCTAPQPIDPTNPSNDPDDDKLGVVTEVGKPIGEPTSQRIGPEGGQLNVADGKLTLVFPAGAIQQETTFTVQPVENKAPGGTGNGYTIEPKAVKVNKPVQVVYHYGPNDFRGSAPELAGIAYQDAQQVWQGRIDVTVDKAARIISTPSLNLSHPIAWYEQYYLDYVNTKLNPGEKAVIQVRFQKGRNDKTANQLTPLSDPEPIDFVLTSDEVRNWRVNGVLQGKPGQEPDPVSGYFTPEAAGAEGTYYAPKSVPAKAFNPVAVSVELDRKDKGVIILVANFEIDGQNWMVIDGKKYENVDVTASYDPEGHVLSGAMTVRPDPKTPDIRIGVSFLIRDYQLSGEYTIKRETDGSSKCIITANDGNPTGGTWAYAYLHNPPPYGVWGPGSVTILEHGGAYEPSVKGIFQATLHNDKANDHRTITVRGAFKTALDN